MGACYDVCFTLYFKNKLNAVSALSAYVIKLRKITDFPICTTMTQVISPYILPQTCHWHFDEENGIFFAAFDASYSWYSVLRDAFDVMTPWLEVKSSLEIESDNDYEKFVI